MDPDSATSIWKANVEAAEIEVMEVFSCQRRRGPLPDPGHSLSIDGWSPGSPAALGPTPASHRPVGRITGEQGLRGAVSPARRSLFFGPTSTRVCTWPPSTKW